MADAKKKIETVAPNAPGSADNCLAEIMRELSSVAVGGSATGIAERIREHFPAAKEEVQKLLSYLMRLRQATESAHQLAVGEEIARRT